MAVKREGKLGQGKLINIHPFAKLFAHFRLQSKEVEDFNLSYGKKREHLGLFTRSYIHSVDF